jgi:hypothetical protein
MRNARDTNNYTNNQGSNLHLVVLGGDTLRSRLQLAHSVSKPWLVNFKVRQFSVTVRTT